MDLGAVAERLQHLHELEVPLRVRAYDRDDRTWGERAVRLYRGRPTTLPYFGVDPELTRLASVRSEEEEASESVEESAPIVESFETFYVDAGEIADNSESDKNRCCSCLGSGCTTWFVRCFGW
jgi:hypothetical protein